MKVKFVPQNVECEIQPGQSVLHVAQDNGIYVKSVCKGVPSCAECRVRVVDGEHNVMQPAPEELSLIGTGHFIDRRRLSCQLKCFGDITVDMSEQIAKQQGLISGQKKKKLSIKDDRIEDVAIRASSGGSSDEGDSPDDSEEGPSRSEPAASRVVQTDNEFSGDDDDDDDDQDSEDGDDDGEVGSPSPGAQTQGPRSATQGQGQSGPGPGPGQARRRRRRRGGRGGRGGGRGGSGANGNGGGGAPDGRGHGGGGGGQPGGGRGNHQPPRGK